MPNQLIGLVLEIGVVKYPAKKSKNQEVGIAVLVPSTEPVPGRRLTCVNLSFGKTPYARMITSQAERSEVENLLANVRWAMNDGFDPTLDILWQVNMNAEGDPICETWELANSDKSEGTMGPQCPVWRYVIRPEKNSLASKVHPWRQAQRKHPRPQLPLPTTVLPPEREAAAEVPHRPEPLRAPLTRHNKTEIQVRGEAYDRRVEATRKRTRRMEKELLRQGRLQRYQNALDSQKDCFFVVKHVTVVLGCRISDSHEFVEAAA